MVKESLLKEYLYLCDKLDKEKHFKNKIRIFDEWIQDKFQSACSILVILNSPDESTIGNNSNALIFSKNKLCSEKVTLKYMPNRCTSFKNNIIIGASDYCREHSMVYIPILSEDNTLYGAFIFSNDQPEKIIKENELEFRLFAMKLKDIIVNSNRFNYSESANSEHFSEILLRHASLWNKLNLPIYLTDIKGNFLFASKSFFSMLGYSNIMEINSHRSIFEDIKDRKDELELIIKNGSVTNYPVKLTTPNGPKEVRDNAILLDNKIAGIFFDVTEYMQQKKNLSEALKMQEFLNDQIFNTVRLLQKTQVSAIKALAHLAEFRDKETGNHLQRICEYTRVLAQNVYKSNPYSFRISREYENDIYISSMLHDIGKVGVPDSILLKPGKLTSSEWKIMQKHTIWGWETLIHADRELGEQSFLTLAAIIALNHHERYDGNGYPNGIRKEDIPLSARIVSVADVYDALTTKRPYKEAWNHERAVEEMIKQKELQFDPILVDIFLEIEDKFHEISKRFPD